MNFPRTHSSFKVRIPNGLRLEGKGWKIALLSLALPNSDAEKLPFVTGADNMVVKAFWLILHLKGPPDGSFNKLTRLEHNAKVKDKHVANAPNGVGYWNQLVQEIEDVIFHTYLEKKRVKDPVNDPNPMMLVKETMCPTFRWVGEDLIINRRYPDLTNKRVITQNTSSNIMYSFFDIAYEVALQWGFIIIKQDGNVIPGPNLHMQIFQDDITTANPHRTMGLTVEGVYLLNGKALHAEPNLDMRRGVDLVLRGATEYDVMWYYKVGTRQWVRLSGNVKWRLTNLNATYNNTLTTLMQPIHKHMSKAVMVYTNLQQSNMVGGSMVQLL